MALVSTTLFSVYHDIRFEVYLQPVVPLGN